MAEHACRKLFNCCPESLNEINTLIICTQTPDYILPPNSPILQDRLNLPRTIQAFDVSHGCSGFVYCLYLAKAVIESGQADHVLVVCSETYSKHINPDDRSVRTVFGDAAAAVLIESVEADQPYMHSFCFQTDGRGATNLIIPRGGARLNKPSWQDEKFKFVLSDGKRRMDNLYMNGPEIFNFAIQTVPALVKKTLETAGLHIDEVSGVIFHQANKMMLDSLRKACRIPLEKFWVHLAEVGNTVSSTIPIVLREMMVEGKVVSGEPVMVVGFGVGYSSAAGIIRF